SRNDNDLTARFPGVARAIAQAVRTPDCVLDGEVCALDEHGRATFSAMQRSYGRKDVEFVYAVFDLLELEGEPLVDLPLTERRERLEQLVASRSKARGTVQVSATFDDGEALKAAAEEQHFE